MAETTELTSICMHNFGSAATSPRDGPSATLEGLGTLAYQANVEILISVSKRISNSCMAQSFLATPDMAVSLALLLSMKITLPAELQ